MLTFVAKVNHCFLIHTTLQTGRIEIIYGCMFSGKTKELIRRLKSAKDKHQKTLIVKPQIDDRYDINRIVSHDRHSLGCLHIESSQEIINYSKGVSVVGIDETQFFDDNITAVCQELVSNGIRVIAAGLNMDYKRKPFGAMPQLLSIADQVTKLSANCHSCGQPANYTYRLADDDQQIMLGEKKEYEARCKNCYEK